MVILVVTIASWAEGLQSLSFFSTRFCIELSSVTSSIKVTNAEFGDGGNLRVNIQTGRKNMSKV